MPISPTVILQHVIDEMKTLQSRFSLPQESFGATIHYLESMQSPKTTTSQFFTTTTAPRIDIDYLERLILFIEIIIYNLSLRKLNQFIGRDFDPNPHKNSGSRTKVMAEIQAAEELNSEEISYVSFFDAATHYRPGLDSTVEVKLHQLSERLNRLDELRDLHNVVLRKMENYAPLTDFMFKEGTEWIEKLVRDGKLKPVEKEAIDRFSQEFYATLDNPRIRLYQQGDHAFVFDQSYEGPDLFLHKEANQYKNAIEDLYVHRSQLLSEFLSGKDHLLYYLYFNVHRLDRLNELFNQEHPEQAAFPVKPLCPLPKWRMAELTAAVTQAPKTHKALPPLNANTPAKTQTQKLCPSEPLDPIKLINEIVAKQQAQRPICR